MRATYVVRAVVNTLNLSTTAGLLVAHAGQARIGAGPDGLLLATGWRPARPRNTALTIGNVVVTRRPALPPPLLRHESRHATQWAACVMAFAPAYAAASAWSWLRTGDPWSRNVFEVRAGLADGGYRASPLRPCWRPAAAQGLTLGRRTQG